MPGRLRLFFLTEVQAMSKRTFWRLWLLPVACMLLVTAGSGQGQAPPANVPPLPSVGVYPPAPPAVPQVTPPAPPSVDELVAQLAKVRQQQSELAKQEKALVEQLRARHQAQTETLIKLGVLAPPAPPPSVAVDFTFSTVPAK